ncbi:MAG TPA: cytochrome C-binding protein [Alphaproteobacteria bacterium]|nr:cytochrome C-binding protein [Alphaproteobacteria bacterium]
MRKSAVVLAVAAAALISQACAAEDAPPSWAFAANPPGAQAVAPDDGAPKHVPNSAVALTESQVKDAFNVPDWHPDNHPAAPDIVMHGAKPAVLACGYCHLPNGQGRPENAGLAGLPIAYIVQQIADFRSDSRKSSLPDLVPPKLMVNIAKAATDTQIAEAAAYFASLDPRPWVRVVETATVPKTHVAGYMLVPDASGGTEPIGHRIVETPENLTATELRDSGSGFVAYVPPGSLKAGEALVTRGGGKTTPCGVCHGADLRGLGPVPRLAGRSPSYLVRQLYDIQHGSRAGAWTPLMMGVVRDLTPDDLVAIVAYVAAQKP